MAGALVMPPSPFSTPTTHYRDFWDAEGCDPYIGSGSLHSNDSGYNTDPVVVRPRPLGFMADVSQTPVYRVKARRRVCK